MQIPRFAFEKFPGAKPELTTQMKSVGEAMAIGRTFQESFQKASCKASSTSESCPLCLFTSEPLHPSFLQRNSSSQKLCVSGYVESAQRMFQH